MSTQRYTIRNADPSEFEEIGRLMVTVYSQLDGFPKENEQPDYFRALANVGAFTSKPDTALLVAVSEENKIAGALVYFDNMIYYGSGGTATKEKNASGFRLLAVDPSSRGQGVGRMLAGECVRRAREKGNQELIIHTTMAMQTAWRMYENMGFKRSADLDFKQGDFPVYGFRLSV
jgi:ribosomal protein S18 acetylase RimI-like enzyme